MYEIIIQSETQQRTRRETLQFFQRTIKLLNYIRKCKILTLGASHSSNITYIIEIEHLNDICHQTSNCF